MGSVGRGIVTVCVYNRSKYTFSKHHLSLMDLYRDNKREVEKLRQVEIQIDVILLKADRITDGVWDIASMDELELSQVCSGKPPKTIKIIQKLSSLNFHELRGLRGRLNVWIMIG